MYAIIETGGKQQKAAPGEKLKIEKLDAQVGDTVRFDKVMLVNRDGAVELGKPYVDGASVHRYRHRTGSREKNSSFQKEAPQAVSPDARPPAGFHCRDR